MAEEIKYKVNADVSAATRGMNKLLSSSKQVAKSFKGLTAAGFGKISKGIQAATNAMKKLSKSAAMGAGIGLVGKAFSSLTGAMGANQKVLDALSSAMNFFIGIANGIIDVLSPLFGWFKKAFTEPKKWWDELVGAFESGYLWIKENIIDLVANKLIILWNEFVVTLLEVRKAWNEFTGDTEEVEEIAKEIKKLNDENMKLAEENKKKYTEIKKVVNDVVDWAVTAAKTVGKSVQNVMKNNDFLISAERQLNALGVAYDKIVEKYDLMAEKQRQLRDDDTQSISDRIKANEELAKILNEQAEKEKANIQARMGIYHQLNAVLGQNAERNQAILELDKELSSVDAKITGMLSEQLTNTISLNKESIEMTKTRAMGEFEVLKAKRDAEAELEEIESNRLTVQLQNLEIERDAKMKLLDEELARHKLGTQGYEDALAERNLAEQEFANQKVSLEKDLTNAMIDEQRNRDEQERAVMENKIAVMQQGISGVMALVGEDSKLGAALAVASAIMDTYVGATKALAQGGVLGYVGAAGVIATGIANVRKIIQQQKKVEGLTGGGGGGGSTEMPTVGPSIGIVGGQSNPNSQLMGAIEGQLGKPGRSYVVSSDIKTQESLDRKINQNATLGE